MHEHDCQEDFFYQQEHVRGNGGQLDAQNAVNDVEEDVKHLQSSQRRGGNVRQWGTRALQKETHQEHGED